MIVRVLLAVVAFVLISYAIRYYRHQNPQQKKKLLWRFGIGGVVLLLLALVATGRLHWLSGVAAAFIVLLQRLIPLVVRLLPLGHHFWKQRQAQNIGGGNTSTVQTDYLRVELDHDSGEMNGEILQGKYAGKTLRQCSRKQLEELLERYRDEDVDSYNLLQAFLQREFGADTYSGDATGEHGGTHGDSAGPMNRKEALDILGLEEGADDEAILAAHKKLMQKLHPDRGGSNYLAAKVNQAKDFLLKKA